MESNSLPVIGNGNSRPKRKWYKNPKLWRQGTMLFFFLFLLRVAYHHQKQGGGPNGEPSVEAYCPFGGLESLYQFVTTGGFIRRIEPSTMIIFAAVILLTLLFSRGFCGWICPFGSIQEWIGMVGKKVLGKRFNPTGAWDHVLRYLKYVILVVIIGLTWWSGVLVFRDYDPFLAFFHLGQDIEEKAWGYGILLVVLIGSFFIERFFCKYACPLGAVLAILGKFGLTKVHRDEEDCKGCNVCQKNCYAHVDFLGVNEINDAECNHCMDCVADCPKPNVLSVRATRWRFSQPAYAGLLIAGLFGMIGVSQATNHWRTKPESIEVRGNSGVLEPGAIRGWMTLNVISEQYGVPLERLYAGSGLPDLVSADAMIKEIRKTYEIEFEPDDLRSVVAAYLEGGSGQAPAIGVHPGEAGGMGQGRGGGQGRGPSAGEPSGEQQVVRGNSTINEIVLKSGIPKDYLLREAGLPEDVPMRTALREWIRDYGKTPRDVREVVEKYRVENR